MVTELERLLKAEHDAWVAQSKALNNQANLDYIAMMSDIAIPTEEVSENESEV